MRTQRRRLIPPTVALVVTLISSLPIYTGWFSDRGANLLSLGIAAAGFAFKAALFFYMRHRMIEAGRSLTIFGRSIVDHWSSIVVFDLVMVGVFGTLLTLTVNAQHTPKWLVLANRSAINGGVALIVGTGAAVAWEMHRAGRVLRVHEEDPAEPRDDPPATDISTLPIGWPDTSR